LEWAFCCKYVVRDIYRIDVYRCAHPSILKSKSIERKWPVLISFISFTSSCIQLGRNKIYPFRRPQKRFLNTVILPTFSHKTWHYISDKYSPRRYPRRDTRMRVATRADRSRNRSVTTCAGSHSAFNLEFASPQRVRGRPSGHPAYPENLHAPSLRDELPPQKSLQGPEGSGEPGEGGGGVHLPPHRIVHLIHPLHIKEYVRSTYHFQISIC
jgi:hypothetical protein